MADSSFDVVSEYDRQEVDNAVNQTAKEISQRYDFKGVGASVVLAGETITMAANAPERVLAVYDVLQTKLVRRGVSLKSLDVGDGEPKQSGKEYRLVGTLRKGLSQDNAKRLSKLVREEGPKGVKVQIQGESLRVTSKSRDALQETIALLKGLAVTYVMLPRESEPRYYEQRTVLFDLVDALVEKHRPPQPRRRSRGSGRGPRRPCGPHLGLPSGTRSGLPGPGHRSYRHGRGSSRRH